MKKSISYATLFGMAVVVLATESWTIASASDEQCHSDWATASTIVASRNMVNVAELSRIAREKFDGQVMTARLCNDGDGYFYRVVIRQDDGRVKRVKINATTPQ